MSQSFRSISPQLARSLRLVMADVDGTLNDGGDELTPQVVDLIHRLEKTGIMVGLVSGRTLSRLDKMARALGISGPIIAENGGIAKRNVDEDLLELGYARQPALEALEKLKKLYPGGVKEREDNLERRIDVVMWAVGVELAEMRKHIGDVQLLDSGYIAHLMQAGISKGKTLRRVLEMMPDKGLNTENTIAIGDSMTDISLFENFPNSIFVPSPRLTPEERNTLNRVAGFVSDHSIDEGFCEAVARIIEARSAE